MRYVFSLFVVFAAGLTPVFAGVDNGLLELVPPGIVEVHKWRPEPRDLDSPDGMPLLGAVARKP